MPIKNHIESQYRSFMDDLTPEYEDQYQSFNNQKLRTIFSTIHADMINSFNMMNARLPTGDETAHFWADPSRTLLKSIERTESLYRGLKNTEYAFRLDDYYEKIITTCKNFLTPSGGSLIPPHMKKIELYYTLPIFLPSNSVEINTPITNNRYNLSLIGEGSYAYVFKYKDDFYQKEFVLKRVKKDLSSKELERFAREFDIMKKLASPYIVEVHNYDQGKNEYIMECMDCSLYDYINKNNSLLSKEQRKNIGGQILRAFMYLHTKDILHRDISLKNILIKKYDHVVVVKVSDFGLVKIPDSQLTSLNTDFKGSLNDPSLKYEGFDNYNISHEIYALTHLLFYVLTGKTNITKTQNIKLKEFVSIGMNSDKKKRFSTISDISKAFNLLF